MVVEVEVGLDVRWSEVKVGERGLGVRRSVFSRCVFGQNVCFDFEE